MMYGRGLVYGSSFGYLHMFFNALIFIAVILLVVIFVKKLLAYTAMHNDSALELLKMRFAKGEIEEKEYLAKLDLLK